MAGIKAFVGHSFRKEDKEIVQSFLNFFDHLKELPMGFSWDHAEDAKPEDLPQKVQNIIEGKNLFIGICTPSELVIHPDDLGVGWLKRFFKVINRRSGQWKASDWIIQEISFAMGRGLTLVLLIQEGTRKPGELHSYNALLIERFVLQGEVDRALIEFNNLKDHKPWRDFFLYKQGLLQLEKKNYDQALIITNEMESPSITRNVRWYVYPRTFYTRGRIYEEMGELVLARENYEKLLSLWQDGDEEIPERQDAIKRLSRIIRMQG